MSVLVLADHDNGQLSGATLNTVTAASQIGGDIHILVAGDSSGDVAKAEERFHKHLWPKIWNLSNKINKKSIN